MALSYYSKPMKRHGRSVATLKREAIANVLANPVYSAESGLIKSLAKHLSKLPLAELNNLNVVVSLRSVESRQQGVDLARMTSLAKEEV